MRATSWALGVVSAWATGAHAQEIGRQTAVEPGDLAPALLARWADDDALASHGEGCVRAYVFHVPQQVPADALLPSLTHLAAIDPDRLRVAVVQIELDTDVADETDAALAALDARHEPEGLALALLTDAGAARAWSYPDWVLATGARTLGAVVDATGHLTWMGHPGELGEAVDAALRGAADVDAARRSWRAATVLHEVRRWADDLIFTDTQPARDRVLERARRETPDVYPALLDQQLRDQVEGDPAAAAALAVDVLAAPEPYSTALLNELAWTLVAPDQPFNPTFLPLARQLSLASNERDAWSEAARVDTWARVLWRAGELTAAADMQARAVALAAPGPRRSALVGTLHAYRIDARLRNFDGGDPPVREATPTPP
jgi:hypothetical protein